MRLSIAIAGTHASADAFVVWRGFESSIRKAGQLGFHGVELALKQPDEINPVELRNWLNAAGGLEVSCISTGQVFADRGLMFTDADVEKRRELRAIFRGLIDLAADFGRLVNMGRVRGRIGREPRPAPEERFIDLARELCDYAATRAVTLVLEPVNRYEIDFVNSVKEGAALLRRVARPNLKLMPDTFHMNIEDASIGGELAAYIDDISYIHFADSNRLAPGQGHVDFDAILGELARVGYDGWLAVEILPKPDPDTAARQAADFLLPRIRCHNRRHGADRTNFPA